MPNETYKKFYDTYWSSWYKGKRSFLRETFADKLIKIFQPTLILDVGCGPGNTLRRLLRLKRDAYAIEYSPWIIANRLKDLKQISRVKEGSITQIPHFDDRFDLVLCTEVLEHIPPEDVSQGIQELIRVCNKYIVCTICSKPSPLDDPAKLDKPEDLKDLKAHATVRPIEWWLSLFKSHGAVLSQVMTDIVREGEEESIDFYVFEV